MTNTDVVKKLVGRINPVGKTTEDNIRFNNLEEMCTLVENLLVEINAVSACIDSHEWSVKRAGKYAADFKIKLGEIIK